MSNHTPPVTPEELEGIAQNRKAHMSEEQYGKHLRAVKTLRERGLPDPSTYSLISITAADEDDLNLKMHLLMVPNIRKYLAGEITAQEISMDIIPLAYAVHFFNVKAKTARITWPATIYAIGYEP